MTLTSLPVTKSPSRPPVKARGMVNMMIKGDRRDWNCATMIRYMNTTARSSISSTCSMASLMVSFSPEDTSWQPAGTW